jgi:hypothetical protein
MWILLKSNLIFFKANEYTGIASFEELFFDFLFNKISNFLPYMLALMVGINIMAIYVSDLMLRPFRAIGAYCTSKIKGEDVSYNPDFFADLKLLTRFSELFFAYISMVEKDEALRPMDIPEKYTKIHQPVFESTFFIHFSLYILISVIGLSICVYIFAIDIHQGIIELARQTLPLGGPINYFLERQEELLSLVLRVVIGVHILMYGMLSFHLYHKVAGPAFGIFATMRSFLKGNTQNRVHLIGFYYLRPQCRHLNKYLDHLHRKLTKK